MKYTGVDGCKAGWFFVSLDDNEDWNIGLLAGISELSGLITKNQLILVDIPIGLPEYGKNKRQCDIAARKVLRARRSSIFPVPLRQAINCTDYEDASRVNYEYTQRKLSRQSWAIAQKIKEMDRFLLGVETGKEVRETHPEICFWALNNYREMKYNKKSREGVNERLAVLLKYCSYAEDIVKAAGQKYQRREAARDDIIDALIIAVTARFYPLLATLPEEVEYDTRGLPMEIVYTRL
jgi:predicted RNase H-like nuclease